MEIEKIRNLGPQELQHQEHEATEQLFRLKFQLKTGQSGGLKKMRELRKDLARIKTIARERELGINGNLATPQAAGTQSKAAQPAESAKSAGAAQKTKKKRVAVKKAAKGKK